MSRSSIACSSSECAMISESERSRPANPTSISKRKSSHQVIIGTSSTPLGIASPPLFAASLRVLKYASTMQRRCKYGTWRRGRVVRKGVARSIAAGIILALSQSIAKRLSCSLEKSKFSRCASPCPITTHFPRADRSQRDTEFRNRMLEVLSSLRKAGFSLPCDSSDWSSTGKFSAYPPRSSQALRFSFLSILIKSARLSQSARSAGTNAEMMFGDMECTCPIRVPNRLQWSALP
mmetsp:Transcript_22295/g.50499  ORF Transcript_22295/g.50499 Transcript_22295/m.50499 type:complete len:235 (-) Transcript_22295:621-1325(-)